MVAAAAAAAADRWRWRAQMKSSISRNSLVSTRKLLMIVNLYSGNQHLKLRSTHQQFQPPVKHK